MKLLTLQTEFQAHVLGAQSTIEKQIKQTAQLKQEKRLAIYSNAYRIRLQDTLRDTFAQTAAYLGDTWFDQVALEYLKVYPSTEHNIALFGAVFPDWLSQQYPKDLEISELAQMDWLLRRAFDGRDADSLTFEDLRHFNAQDWENMRFSLIPNFRTTQVLHNTLAIWKALDMDETPPALETLPCPVTVIIWRLEHQPHYRTIGELEQFALAQVQASQPFGAMCEAIQTQFPNCNAAQECGLLLRRWIDEQLLLKSAGPRG